MLIFPTIIIQRLLFTSLEETAEVAQWARAFASQGELGVKIQAATDPSHKNR